MIAALPSHTMVGMRTTPEAEDWLRLAEEAFGATPTALEERGGREIGVSAETFDDAAR